MSDYLVFIENGLRNTETLARDTVGMVNYFMVAHEPPLSPSVGMVNAAREMNSLRDVTEFDFDMFWWCYEDWEFAAQNILGAAGYALDSNGDVTGIIEIVDEND